MEEKTPKPFYKHLITIIKWRNFIIKSFLIACGAAIIISFLIPPKYTATASIMPPNLEQDALFGLLGLNVSSTLSKISQLGGIPGMSTPSDLYAAIMKSDRIKGEIINRFNLKKEFRARTKADAGRMLEEITAIRVSAVGIISVSVTYKDKNLAAAIANAFIEELDKFNRETAMTTGKKYRIFVEQRLKETQDSLTRAEETLKKFQEQHRTVALDVEIKNAIETIAKLKSEIILREVQKGAVSSASNLNNPYVANIDRELRELKNQLSKIEFGSQDTSKKEFGAGFSVPFARLPALSLEYARLLRDVKVQEAVYELLTQQYEQAKIMEAKDTPTIQILDRASPPEKKSSPRRLKILILTGFFSLIFATGTAYILEWIQNTTDVQKQNSIWWNLYYTAKSDFKKIINWFRKIFRK
ncbi:MAG: GNVR domain-containing protein [candidate division WOR-3 bacterium]